MDWFSAGHCAISGSVPVLLGRFVCGGIGVKEFMCIGESPPQDHPHVYINMGEADTILCPYCATRSRFDPRLTPLDADPPDSFFTDHNAV